jgi:hypothetical protein
MIKQNYDEIAEVIEEKFTRCPRCRHYSVKQTNHLSFKERMKARFLPVTAYICDNCSYRFVEEGELPTGLKVFFAVLANRLRARFLLAAVPLAAAAVVVIFILLSGSGNKKPDYRVENEKKTGQIEQKQITPPDRPVEKKTVEVEEKEPIFDIILGNSNRFGVNWRVVKDGVQITRMSEGPLKRAGLKIGDVLSDVDDIKITSGNYLLRMRNEIFYGRRTEALIKVYRGGKLYLYKMVKTKTPSPGPGTDANDTRDSIDTGLVPPNLDIVLTVELADHGIHWANTDIYIVVK